VTDPDGSDLVTEIDLFRGISANGVVPSGANAVLVAASDGNAKFAWRERTSFATGTEVHYYLRIRQSDNAITWTGPVYVTYDPNFTTAVGDRDLGSKLTLRIGPNPSLGRATASFSLPRASRNGELMVYDAAGRHVKTLLAGPLSEGPHQATWTGLDENGRAVPSGVFFMRLKTDNGVALSKVLMMR
jgi:hypothetical protein